MRRWAGRIGFTLFIAALLNIFAFFWHVDLIGGSAGNGKQEGGRYFVARTGRYTEVPEQSWQLARIHEVAFWASFPLAIVVVPLLIAYSESRGRAEDAPSDVATNFNQNSESGNV